MLPIPTARSPADAGTKILAAKRIRMLGGMIGLVDAHGNKLAEDAGENVERMIRSLAPGATS